MFGLSVCGLNIVGCCSSMELKKSIEDTFALTGGGEVEGGGAAGCDGPGIGARLNVNENA